jgi:squalene-hopene/tetraprenyl-beta-curcumene cyclase
MLCKGINFLMAVQNPDHGWGGAQGVVSSQEETALAVNALAHTLTLRINPNAQSLALDPKLLTTSINHGTAWLIKNTQQGTQWKPSPIGLYFARLWYYEKLYPLIFTTRALERVNTILDQLDDT